MTKPSSDVSVARDNLMRIARTLDQPVTTFFAAASPESREAETLAMVKAFECIRDPQARARCLAFVTAEAERS